MLESKLGPMSSLCFHPNYQPSIQIAMLESELGGVNKTMKSLSVQGWSLSKNGGFVLVLYQVLICANLRARLVTF